MDPGVARGLLIAILLMPYFLALSYDRGQIKERRRAVSGARELYTSALTGVVSFVYWAIILAFYFVWLLFLRQRQPGYGPFIAGQFIGLGGVFFLFWGWMKLRLRMIVGPLGLDQGTLCGKRVRILKWADVAKMEMHKKDRCALESADILRMNPTILITTVTGKVCALNLGRFRSRLATLEIVMSGIPPSASVDPMIRKYHEKLGARIGQVAQS